MTPLVVSLRSGPVGIGGGSSAGPGRSGVPGVFVGLVADLRTVARRVGRVVRGRVDRVAVDRATARLGPKPVGHYRAAVYFADERINLYQVRQWYEPLAKLSTTLPVLVISTNATTARVLRHECPLPVFFAPTVADIERRIASEPLDVVFYVNQNASNFSMMRFRRPAHVFLSHGESDKDYMASNQLKAYDVAFVAGEAARDRIRRCLIGYDVDRSTREIGRPQVDVITKGPALPDDGRTTVLYAPTWEGDRPTMSYSSIATHGVRMVRALLRAEGYRVIYRPHPRTGSHDRRAARAHREITAMIDAANKHDVTARHLVDTDTPFGWHLQAADVCLTDVSAVAFDWLATGKPLLVTEPESPDARVGPDSIVHRLPSIGAESAGDAPALIEQVRQDRHDDARRELARYYFGDITPGAAMRRFLAAATAVAEERAAARAR